MLNDDKRHSFKPATDKGYLTNILTALAVAIMLPVGLWLLKDEDDPLTLAIFGVGGAIGTLAFYTWRDLRVGLQRIEITPETLSISGRRKSQTIKWQNVSGAKHKLRAGERWLFELKEGHEPVVFFAQGYSTDEIDEINNLITERLDAHGVPTEKTMISDFKGDIDRIFS